MARAIETILLAIGPSDRDHVEVLLDEAMAVAGPDELASRHNSIRTPSESLEARGIEYEIRGVVGNPDNEIVRVAGELDTDRIVVGGEGRSPTGKAVFGDYT